MGSEICISDRVDFLEVVLLKVASGILPRITSSSFAGHFEQPKLRNTFPMPFHVDRGGAGMKQRSKGGAGKEKRIGRGGA